MTSVFWSQPVLDAMQATERRQTRAGHDPASVSGEVGSGQTVGDLLGISIDDAQGVGFYDVGSEPVTTTRRVPPPSSKARRVKGRELEAYLAAARGGATDSEIARQAGVSLRRVRRWRQRNGIVRPRGRMPTEMRAVAAATELLSRPFEPVVSHVGDSPVQGRFEPPHYLLRAPLRYDLLCDLIAALRKAGFQPDEIARGIGLRLVDVEHAEALGGS